MDISNLLGKYQQLEFKHSIDLFNDIPLYAINTNQCPFCGLKLYANRAKTMRWCKSNSCPSFIQTKKRFFTKK